MATSWAEIITDYGILYIDDVRLTEKLEVSPALFFREMSIYMVNAIPMLNRPPELMQHLQKDMVLPKYDDYEWVSTAESTSGQTLIPTEKVGFEMMSCVIREDHGGGKISFAPYTDAQYDPETGNVTFPKQEKSGIDYVIDFYSDGAFSDLSQSVKRLLGLAMAIVWDTRFERTWLDMTPKIKDSSFDTVNESNYIEKNSKRRIENKNDFEDELRKYEQDLSYMNTVSPYSRNQSFI